LGESLNTAREAIDRAMETLREEPSRSQAHKRDLMTRLQLARNTLVQNERKIWLRTKVGKEMLGGFGEAAERLLDHVESDSGLEEIEAALADVELHAKRIDEETRRRDMVVT
jgi:hypothetical protein